MNDLDVSTTRINPGRRRAGGWRAPAAALLLSATLVNAHDAAVLQGRGSAVLDGVLSAGEWDAAGRIDFRAKAPPHDGGGDMPATLMVMHDDENLYLAVRIERAGYGLTQPIFEFDNDHDGILFEPGDDIIHMYVGDFEAATFFDVYRHACAGGGDPSFAGCSSLDSADGGTTDGAAAAGHDGAYIVIEIVHPLAGGDDAHDFRLVAGNTVGFHLTLHLFSLDRACNYGPECVVDTELAGDIGVARQVTAASIDVMPGSTVNPVNLRQHGVVPVAILGTLAFDALSVDPATVCFGAADDAGARDCTEAHGQGHAGDVNADGLPDLVLHFEAAQTGIAAGDTRACLVGRTYVGDAIEGCDAIRTVVRGAGVPRRGRWTG